MKKTASYVLLLALSLSSAVGFAQEAATKVVDRLHSELLAVMKAGSSLSFKDREARLAPVLEEVFDFDAIAKIVTGKHWGSLAEEKRSQFRETFKRLSVATYADNFAGFSGETFSTDSMEDKRGAQLVKTTITDSEGHKTPLHYLLVKHGDAWRVVNVVADGVSDLNLKRAEYDSIIASQGIDALVAKLEAKVASYEGSSKH